MKSKIINRVRERQERARKMRSTITAEEWRDLENARFIRKFNAMEAAVKAAKPAKRWRQLNARQVHFIAWCVCGALTFYMAAIMCT